MKRFVDIIPRGLIVSCQAKRHSPLRDSDTIARLARAAELGGAVAIRANGPEDIRKIKKLVSVPVIGINKVEYEEGKIIITPTIETAAQVVEAGADVIALDATDIEYAARDGLGDLVEAISGRLEVPIMADVSTLEEGLHAAQLGVGAIATTLSGYTPRTAISREEWYRPDMGLLRLLIERIGDSVPLIAEGRFWEREDVRTALQMGIYAVVIGKAVTNAQAIARYYVDGIADIIPPVHERSL
jgi:N-acylglucosamine-6-phosphate 2-epimerase